MNNNYNTNKSNLTINNNSKLNHKLKQTNNENKN